MPDSKKPDPIATRISDDVIAQALESVERHTSAEANVPAQAAAAAAQAPQEAPAAAGAAQAEPSSEVKKLSDEVRKLRADLLEARQALRQREAELEASQAMSRQTLEKLKDQHERMLRAAADLENYKKRAARERDESNKYGQERLLREVLPVLDNLDRALEHAGASTDFEGLQTGIVMTRKLCEDTLARFGVKGFSSLGTPFDPTLHEAMQAVESDQPAGSVVQEMVRGYMLHDRLMRPAMVVVAKARAAAAAPAPVGQAAAPAAAMAPDGQEAPPAAAMPQAEQPAQAAGGTSGEAASQGAPGEVVEVKTDR